VHFEKTAVRPATTADHPEIREMLHAAYAPYAARIAPEVYERYLADLLDLDRHARDGELLVAEIDGRIAGYAAYYPDAALQHMSWPRGWASGRGLAVRPSARGRGVASTLITEVTRRARDSGAPVFAFHTSAFMTTAVALYERLGYERAPQFDVDVNAHYGVRAPIPWMALAYLRRFAAHGAPRTPFRPAA
jgi:GNAT superfamily N-acetyltransferase